MREKAIPHRECGKLIVGKTDADLPRLRALYENGMKNGLSRLELWNHRQAMRFEPYVRCAHALFSPYSSVFDSHAVMAAMQAEISECSISDEPEFATQLITSCTFQSARRDAATGMFTIETSLGSINAHWLVNAAGLHASRVAAQVQCMPKEMIPRPFFAKGTYFKLSGVPLSKMPFKSLIYPLPERGGLGVHATVDLHGAVRFGPDVEWIPSRASSGQQGKRYDFEVDEPLEANYDVNDAARDSFVRAIETYWPGIKDLSEDQLVPDYCGIRPKLHGPDSSFEDFFVQVPRDHKVHNLINLYGIESPGWTSALALGALISDMIIGDR